MEKDKSRGLKHIKDKQKYKGNTNKNIKYVPQKTQPNLGSNWDRYENEDGDDDNENILGTDKDFAVLAEAPIAKGKHFQSKRDKLLAKETESVSLSGLFTVNLEQLEESLLTIPFYKRVEIDEKYFLENQIEFMNQAAEECLKKYIESRKLSEHVDACSETSEESEDDNLFDQTQIQKETIQEKTEETKQSKVTNKNNEELEQWLDDFLNE